MNCALFIMILFLVSLNLYARGYKFPDKGVMPIMEELDSFYDRKTDYSRFGARVTDRDYEFKHIKIKSEAKNVKFLKIGDKVTFKIPRIGKGVCIGYVRDQEDNYLVVRVDYLHTCWPQKQYFRRGTQLTFQAPILNLRVREGSAYRRILLDKRRDYFKQLNEVNNLEWGFDQEKVQVAAEYDQKILNLEEQKRAAMDSLMLKRKENAMLAKELRFQLRELEALIDRYQVNRDELFSDRWYLDREDGKPMQIRPERKFEKIHNKHRWKTADFE